MTAQQHSVDVASEPPRARVDDANGTTCSREKIFNANLCSQNWWRYKPLLAMMAAIEAVDAPSLKPDRESKKAESIYWPWEWNWFGWNKKSHSSHKTTKVLNSPQIELPGNLAMGFALMLSGALLYILPYGVTQFVGAELVVMGAGFVANGLVNEEKPYTIDREQDGTAVPPNGF